MQSVPSKAHVLAAYAGSAAMAPLPEKAPGAVRLVCQSDTHARFESAFREGRATVPNGDIYLHAGDFSSMGMLEDIKIFHNFVAALPHKHKIVIAGNHDITMHGEYYRLRGERRFHSTFPQNAMACQEVLRQSTQLTYLQDSGVNVMGLKIWGSPWQPEFYDWAFNLERGQEIRRVWDLIPTETDVLMTHGPPFRHGDLCDHGGLVGCEDLLRTVESRVRPAVHVFGHIHEGYGITRNEWTTFVNASTCTLRYRPTNPCIVVDIMPAGVAANGDVSMEF